MACPQRLVMAFFKKNKAIIILALNSIDLLSLWPIKHNHDMKYLLQHGNYGEGPINPFLVSNSPLSLLQKAREIVGNHHISNIRSKFDQDGSIHIQLDGNFEHNGFTYNMFFIDKIEEL